MLKLKYILPKHQLLIVDQYQKHFLINLNFKFLQFLSFLSKDHMLTIPIQNLEHLLLWLPTIQYIYQKNQNILLLNHIKAHL